MPEKLAFERLPALPDPEELLDKAFRQASKAASALRVKGPPLEVAKQREAQRISVMSRTIKKMLIKLVAGTPSLSNLPPFYQELVEALVSVDEVRKLLGAINGSAKVITKLEREHLRRLRVARSPAEAAAVRKQAYGRIPSVLKRARDHLKSLKEAFERLSDLPSVYVDMPTVVIAGYPNVGKTMLLKQLTGSEPEIAPYPFTTKGLKLGYFERDHERYQVIDTPGLLDRPLEKRNPIERQAIAALRHLADFVIFVLDPSETCGYELESQLHLLEDVRRTFLDVKVLAVMNKADLFDERRKQEVQKLCKDAIFTSAAVGKGVAELEELIVQRDGEG